MLRALSFWKSARAPWVATALALLAVLVVNGWMNDDAFITLRTVDNVVRGHGLTWNVTERVQVYTHPLWMAVLVVAYGITREAFYTTLLIQLALGLFVWAWLSRGLSRGRPLASAALALLLASSKAFVDFSTSGLENALTHALFVVFALPLVAPRDEEPEPPLGRTLLLAALAHLNRADTVLVFGPLAAWVTLRELRRSRRHVVRPIALAAAPVLAWYAFATFYYGFPLPNTAYAKLGGGASLLHPHATGYFTNSLAWDPVTLVTIALGVLAAAAPVPRATAARRALALGVGVHLFYVLRIGGDYMSGRFFALPFLAAVVLLASSPRALRSARRVPALAAALAALAFVGPRPPLRSFLARPRGILVDASGVTDERVRYEAWASLLAPEPEIGRPHAPGKAWVRAGTPEVVVAGGIGRYGFESGPDRHIVDPLALGDALVARLPPLDPERDWGRGHLLRAIPDGYVESLASGRNLLVDPDLAAYYEALSRVIAGPLWAEGRLRDIVFLNSGAANAHLQAYAKRSGLLRVVPPTGSTPGFLPLEQDAAFLTGAWGLERDGASTWRWLGARAEIRLPPLRRGDRVLVHGFASTATTFSVGLEPLAPAKVASRVARGEATFVVDVPDDAPDARLVLACDGPVRPDNGDDRALCFQLTWIHAGR